MTARKIYKTIKEKPYKDGEEMIKKHLIDFLIWYEETQCQNHKCDLGFVTSCVTKFESHFYCENRICEAMLPCGNQCDTCESYEKE